MSSIVYHLKDKVICLYLLHIVHTNKSVSNGCRSRLYYRLGTKELCGFCWSDEEKKNNAIKVSILFTLTTTHLKESLRVLFTFEQINLFVVQINIQYFSKQQTSSYRRTSFVNVQCWFHSWSDRSDCRTYTDGRSCVL